MSSLENQLKRLRIPENSSLERATKYKKRTSFLFEPKEASDIDNETVFALALNGLDQLKLLNGYFEAFEGVLFHESSKQLERSLLARDVNDKLDSSIKDYLQFLSPYILLKPAHKTLEWLIRRFQIHLYNVDDLLACVFPYHQSNVFARIVQLLSIANTKWSWLVPIQKTGSPLPRSTIIQHCLSNPGFLSFISGLVFNAVKTKPKAGQGSPSFSIFTSFYASTIAGVVESMEKVSEEILSSLLPHIIHGLKSDVADLQAASYMVIGQLTIKCTLQPRVIKSLLKTMCKNATTQIAESLLMCVNCLCSSHNLSAFPKKAYCSLCKLPNLATLLCNLSKNYQMDSFIKVFLSHLVKTVVRSIVDDKQDIECEMQSSLLSDLLRNMDVDESVKTNIARSVLDEYIGVRRVHGDESSVVTKLNDGVKKFVRIIQNRWQFQMDRTIQDYLVSLQNGEVSHEERQQNLRCTQDFVSLALSNIGSQIVCDTGSTLVIALHHPEAEIRKLALKKVSNFLKEPMHSHEDQEFLKESLLVRLNDEDPAVVLSVLKLKKGLINICRGEPLVTSLIKLLEKNSSKWTNVFEQALDILLSDDILGSNPSSKHRIVFQLMPLMFLGKKNVSQAKLTIDNLFKSQLTSEWLVNSLGRRDFRENLGKCTKDSTYQELAITNTMLLCTLAENIALLESESTLKMMKTMQDHANKEHDQTFLIMFIMISAHLLTVTKDDIQKLDLISLTCRRLLCLVTQVTQVEVLRQQDRCLPAELDGEILEIRRDDCGGVPVNLMANYMYTLRRKNAKKLEHVKSRIYLNVLRHVIKCLSLPTKDASIWWKYHGENQEREQYTKILCAVFEVLLLGLGKGRNFEYQDEFQSCLETMIKVQFPENSRFLKFLAFFWSIGASQKSEKEQSGIPIPSAVAIVQSLHVAQVLVKSLDEKTMTNLIISEHSPVFPSLIVPLTSPVMAIRQAVLQTIALIVSRSPVKTAAVISGSVLSESSEEITADEDFIASVFQNYISSVDNSPVTHERRKSKSRKSLSKTQHDVLEYILNHIVNEETPSYVVRVLLAALNKVVTKSFLLRCFPSVKTIIDNHLKYKECSADQSQILLYFIQKFTQHTGRLFKTEPQLLEMFLQLLTLSEPFSSGHMTPQQAVLIQMSAQFFEVMNDENILSKIFSHLIDVLMNTSDPATSAKLKEILKLIPISAEQIEIELSKLHNEENEKPRRKKRAKTAVSEDTSSSLGLSWQRVITIIELLQVKDNINEPDTLLGSLFRILSMCLEMPEQTSSDYLRQLVLSTILKICQTCLDQGKHLAKGVLSEQNFSVEQVIHCIRVSGNPQTHHHALSLLSIGAQLFPEKVLHNIMSIFTFMGVNVLRQDDTYSFQVIKRTVEAVIPALIQAEQNQQNIRSLVTKVLRVFVDAFPHVPEHRRLPIFVHLLNTVGTATYLHVCLALLLEKISNKESKDETKGNTRESGLIFSISLCNEFSPDKQMTSLVSLLKFIASLPEEKPEGYIRKRRADTSDVVFDVNSHSEKELHQFKLSVMELILRVLGNDNFVIKITHLPDDKHDEMKQFYLSLLEEILKYVTSLSKSLESSNQEMTKKFLRVLLRKVSDALEEVTDLLPGPTFVDIVSQLIHNSNSTIRRKTMDLFNKRVAEDSESYSGKEMSTLLLLLDAVIVLIQNEEETAVNKQSAFYTVIVLARLLGDTHALTLKKVLAVAITSVSDKHTKPQVVSSALLCLAELCSLLKVHTIPFLSKFFPSVLKIVEMKENEARNDVLLLSALTVVHKVVQSLPNFISPYLQNIITQLLSPSFVQFGENLSHKQLTWKNQVVDRAISLRADIAVLIKPRILIPVLPQCYEDIAQKGNNESVMALFELLRECVTHMSKEDVKNYNEQMLSLFISGLDYRSQYGQDISEGRLQETEDTIITAFLNLVMKLSEALFRPMFLKLVDWATRTSSNKLRLLVFYRLADRMAEKLKGLFVLFAGYIIKNIAAVLDSNNITKAEEMFFGDQVNEMEKSCQLLNHILDCLYKCFLYDNQRFVNKERFDRLLKPLVDQIENQIGVDEVFHERVSQHLAPCLAQFAAAAGDESYWKAINHHVCLKTRHSSSQVRLAALKVVQQLNHKLGEEYLTLLPEIIPFLAELMEDDSFEVEQQCQQVISEMEEVLGESLQKYF